MAAVVEVHGEEGGVEAGVDVAKAVVELDAVVDADAARQLRVEADGVAAQVAVAVAYPALVIARLQQCRLALQEISRDSPRCARSALG